MNENKTLIIWLKNGNTCLFEKVNHFSEEDGRITFHYFGVSTQVKRKAVFLTANIAGYAFQCNNLKFFEEKEVNQ